MTGQVVRKWGIELEGGWKAPPDYEYDEYDNEYGGEDILAPVKKKLLNRWTIHDDGSIELDDYDDAIAAELVVAPPARDLAKLKADLRTIWPLLSEVNGSMGGHIHTSFGVGRKDGPRNLKYYAMLSSWEFVNFFQTRVRRKFDEVARRIDQDDEDDEGWGGWSRAYSSPHDFECDYYEQSEAPFKSGRRNRAINYCYGLHGSIEFRAFPMAHSVARACQYLDFVDDTIDAFAAQVHAKRIAPKSLFSLN